MFEQQPLLPDAKQLFSLYEDMNDLTIPGWDNLVDTILQQQHKNIITFHKYGFVFFYVDQLIREEISAEQFLTMGDIEGQIEDQINPHVYREEHPVYLSSLTREIVQSWTSEDLVVLDSLLVDYYQSHNGALVSDAQIVILK